MDWYLNHGEKIGIVGHLIFDVVAFMNGWIYTAKSYNNLLEEKDELRKIVDDANRRDREKLERLEQRLDDALRRGQ